MIDDEEKVIKPKQKEIFIIKVEGNVPVTVDYKIWAYDEEDAYNQFTYSKISAVPMNQPRFEMQKLRPKKISIKNLKTNLINWVKNF